MKIDRLVSMIMVLLDKKRVGARELADMFEVSPRTIYRDIDAINMAGVPIRSVPGVGGGFEIMPEYKVDKAVFSAADLSAILMGLTGLSTLIRGEELVNALAKVRSFLPAEKAGAVEKRADQVRIDPSSWWGDPDLRPRLQTVRTAMEAHRLLSFSYIAHRGEKTARTVEPYQLLWKSGHWYFYGYCRGKSDYRLFRLSRALDLRMERETFTPREPQRPVLDFEEVAKPMRTEIKLRIHRSILDRVLAFCPYDRFLPDGDEYYIVAFPFIDNEYHYDLLLGFGDKCECLAPAHVRGKMEQKIHDMAALYGGPRA